MTQTTATIKRILLLGASGRTGKYILEYALKQGFEVVALVRNPDKIATQSPRLKVIKGAPDNANDISNAIVGCDAVISALNKNRTSDLPWAKPLGPEKLMTTSISNAIAAMKTHNLRRIVVLCAMGVGDSAKHAGGLMNWMIRNTNLSVTYADHESQEAALRASGLDWTSARAAGLSNAETLKSLIVSYDNQPKASMSISRKQVAKFMVDGLSNTALFSKAPVVSER
jgi:putative NADH-flavin reductase